MVLHLVLGITSFLNSCRWSPDGNYFARLQQDAVSVYEMPVSVFCY